MRTEAELMDVMTTPGERLVGFMKALRGDIIVLGAGGKMGPSLSILAARALNEAKSSHKVIAVSRFSDEAAAVTMREAGVELVSADLMDEAALRALPDAPNVIYMAGRKFGTSGGGESLTWAMNAYLPGRVAERYRSSRIVAFSTGNVQPYLPIAYGGSNEETPPAPVGEYAQSCLGRERVFEYFSRRNGTPVLLYRLSYAIDMRYGVLHDIGLAVYEERPIRVDAGVFVCIWQGDANDWAIRSLDLCASPASILNATGPETLSIRQVAEKFGALFGKPPVFEGQEAREAAFASAAKACGVMGYPSVPAAKLIEWNAEWIASGGVMWDKPTHFEETKGKY